MASTIIITGANVDRTQKNRFRLTLPQSQDFSRYKIGLSSLSIPYCWANLNVTNGLPVAVQTNGNFQIIWPNGSGPLTFNVSCPADSFFEVSDLNGFLQFFCLTNNLYLVNAAGQPVYYMSLNVNQARYAVQFNSIPLPTTLGTYTYPPGATWTLPPTPQTPQIVVPGGGGYNNGTFSSFLGFSSGTWPAVSQTTTYSKISDFVPTVSYITTIFVTTSLANNTMSIPTSVIYSFSPNGVAFGANIVETPLMQCIFLECMGCTNSIDLQFFDQAFNPLNIIDPAGMAATLTLIPKSERIIQ